jgi:hypothetical protein
MASAHVCLLFASLPWGSLAAVTPFKDFIKDVHRATYDEVMQRNGAYKVRDSAAFEEMRRHIVSHYTGVNVTHSFLDEHHFDCITIESQPSLPKGSKPATPPPTNASWKEVEHSMVATSRLTQGLVDKAGNAIRCEAGTIPMLRLTLDRVLAHETLDHFFAKYPGGPSQKLVSDYHAVLSGSPHKYSHAYQTVNNHGGTSDLNIWNPSGDFTLSQQWYVAHKSDGTVQTAECGNVRYPAGSWSDASLFIYRTNNGYASGSGCYNLDCAGFVQTNHTYALGAHWSHYSTQGGDQYSLKYGYQLFEGNWWLQLGGTNVGYYPGSVYDNGPMATESTKVDFGGETYNDNTDAWPQMGSGSFAGSGWQQAAYHKEICYLTTDASPSCYAASLTTSADDVSCYTIDYHYYGDSSWGTYFFFGGPGGPVNGCSSHTSRNIIV